MNEQVENLIEQQEHISTTEEIHSVFKELTDKEYTEVLKREDEKGVYRLDVTIPGNLEGEITEYSYMRSGKYPEGSCMTTEIYVNYYENDIPVGGTSAARLIDGKWKVFNS